KIMAKLPEVIGYTKINKNAIALGLLFATVFLFFETLLIYFDADLEAFTQGKVVVKTLLSCVFAGTVSIVYFFLESRLEKNLGLSTVKSNGNSFRGLGLVVLMLLSQSFVETLSKFSPKGEDFQSSIIDSLKMELANLPSLRGNEGSDTASFNLYNAIFQQYLKIHPDSALYYAHRQQSIAKKLKDSKRLAAALNNIARVHWMQGNYPETLKNIFEKLRIHEQIKDRAGIALTLSNIGLVYWNQGDYPKALKYYFKALVIDKELGNRRGMAKRFGNIGLVYDDQGDHPKALKHYFEALEIDKELGNKRGMAIRLGNIGIAYYDQGSLFRHDGDSVKAVANFTKALKHHFEALKIDKELGDKRGMAIRLGNIGIVYRIQGDYPKALKHYFEALEMAKEFGDKRSIAINLGSIGRLYTDTKKYEEAERYLKQAIEITKEIGVLYYEKYYQENISTLYAKTYRYSLALKHYKKYDNAKDSLYNEEKSKEIGKLEMKHEMEIAEFNRNQKEEQEAKVARIQKAREDKIGYTLVLVGFIVVLAISMLLSRLILPEAVIQIATTIPFLLLFETAIVFLDPHIEAFSENAPAYKLTANFLLALSLFPIHNKAEQLLKRLFSRKLRKKAERRKGLSATVISTEGRNLDQKH
ncbi:tetratricopeptide repeat protein, partial [Candidatus Amoebophilus asiaticus]|nr:tetratricopeptide repeat protein [Candidatus Amoebophilus asiaticus]